ncbi:MAG: response regulator [Deltaproteobacteria bacterium]
MERKRLLIVDDSERIRDALTDILRKVFNEYQIDNAKNGKEAIEIVEVAENPYDLIITDLNMPFMNGYELVQKLRAIDRYREVYIIGYSSKMVINYREKGFNSHVNKLEGNIRQLITIIENAFDVNE